MEPTSNDCENDCVDWYENKGQNYIVDENDMSNAEEDLDSDNEWDIGYLKEESRSEQDDYESELEEE